MLTRGADLVGVQNAAGHSSPETTSNYMREGLRAAEKATRYAPLAD